MYKFSIAVVCNFLIAADLVDLNSETDEYKDYRFTKWMTKNVGLQAIPPTAFYGKANKHLAENFVRYCFIKVGILYAYLPDLTNEYFCRKMKIYKKLLKFLRNGKMVKNDIKTLISCLLCDKYTLLKKFITVFVAASFHYFLFF